MPASPADAAPGPDPIARLLFDEAPADAGRVLCLDFPAAALAAAQQRFGDVVAYADRLDAAASVPALDAGLLEGVTCALLYLPPGLDALDDTAERLAAWGAPELHVVAAGRVKHMTRGQNDVLARHFSTVRASLGRDKCRALHAAGPLPAPLRWPRMAKEPATGFILAAHGATFNGARLDAGTRLLFSTERQWTGGDAVDLGSGNGVIACVLADRGDAVTAIDISRAAVASTRESLLANDLTGSVLLADGLHQLDADSADLIVTNPPFHVGAAKDSTPTLRMLADSRRVLRDGGELWCVFNSHLPYLHLLRDRFDDAHVVARDRAYTVARAA